jgi:hypothetical protein
MDELLPTQLFKMGTVFRIAGKHKAAITLFSQALDGGFRTAKCHFNLASSLSEVGDFHAAISNFSCSVELDENFRSDATTNIAAIYIRMGEPQNALDKCEDVLSQDKFNQSAWCNLNTALRMLGRTEEAIFRSWTALKDLTEGQLRRPMWPSQPMYAVDHLTVVCVKFGKKYDADYVNKLAAGVQRHLSRPHHFICFTDDPTGIFPTFVVSKPLSTGILKGWWHKAYLFSEEACAAIGHSSRVMYIDLDTVIVGTLDEIASFQGEFGTLSTDGMVNERREGGLNSSVMMWTAGSFTELWTKLVAEFDRAVSRITYKFDVWIEMMVGDKAQTLQSRYPQQLWEYAAIQDTGTLPPSARLVTFPLDPKPRAALDDWVVSAWVL